MKKLILLTLITSSIYASGFSKSMMGDCNYMYTMYKSDYRSVYYYVQHSNITRFDPCTELGKVKRTSSFIEEAQDEIYFLEYQKKTLGLACEQVKQGIEISYKSEYCKNLTSSSSQQIVYSEPVKKQTVQYQKQVEIKQIDPAIKYKNTPQLILSKLRIYNITNITYFREQKEFILIESSIGNYAIPKNEIVNAERINFTSGLSQKLDNLLQ